MKILLPTYRSIGWIVKAYAHLHEKYWGAPVVLLAEEDYSEGQFEFACPPWREDASWVDGGVSNEIPSHHFTDVLIWYLKQIEDKHVIIMLADYLLIEPVKVHLIKQLQAYMELDEKILRGHIGCGDGAFYKGQVVDTYKDLEIWEGEFYPASLCPAIWNRELLLEMMQPRNTAWDFEVKGQAKFPWKGCRSIAAQPIMIRYVNSLRARDMFHMVMSRSVYDEIKQYLKIDVQHFID